MLGLFVIPLIRRGQPLDLADLEIASIALAGDFTLVTGNTRHFGRIEGVSMRTGYHSMNLQHGQNPAH